MKDIPAKNRWAVTGTPVQNRLADLASLLQFLQIYPFSSLKAFDHYITKPWKAGHPDAIMKLTAIFQCVALRRSKEVVDLPERRDEIHYIAFDDDERDAYNAIRDSTLNQINALMVVPEINAGNNYLNVLQWINSLRLTCNLGTMYRKKDIEMIVPCNWTVTAAQEAYQNLYTSGCAICSQCSLDIGLDSLENTQLSVSELDRPHLSRCMELLCGECYQYRLANSFVTCSKVCQFHQSCDSLEVAPSDLSRSQADAQITDREIASGSSSKVLTLINELKEFGNGEKRYVTLIPWKTR